ncbi:hypothetical protein FBY13_10397 [Pantoea sp. SJZ147]|nr:hypothetical protein FBY13_10397 [Pantoea sp. SJZ147]
MEVVQYIFSVQFPSMPLSLLYIEFSYGLDSATVFYNDFSLMISLF